MANDRTALPQYPDGRLARGDAIHRDPRRWSEPRDLQSRSILAERQQPRRPRLTAVRRRPPPMLRSPVRPDRSPSGPRHHHLPLAPRPGPPHQPEVRRRTRASDRRRPSHSPQPTSSRDQSEGLSAHWLANDDSAPTTMTNNRRYRFGVGRGAQQSRTCRSVLLAPSATVSFGARVLARAPTGTPESLGVCPPARHRGKLL